MQNKTLQMKRALRTALLVLLLSVVGMGKGYAYDFSAACETGQILYYNIIDAENHYVTLTCPGTPNNNNCWSGYTQPSGEITLPGIVQHDGIIYTVTSIGNYALSNCSNLIGNITIPNSVTSIGDYAFSGCYQLTGNLIIPNDVASIGVFAFGGCDGFTGNLTIGNSVSSIGERAFKNCFYLTGNLIIPNSVTSIGSEAFAFCRCLTSITISNSVTFIGENPVCGCYGLEQITVESGNPVYDSRGNCNAIIKTSTNQLISGCKNSNIPNSVTTIGEMAFWSCINLTTITIPNSVTRIGEYAFGYCTQLTSITIPNSIIFIDKNPFSGCSGLEQITVESGNPVYDSRGNCNAIIKTNTNELVSGCKNSIIPSSATSIGTFAFVHCSYLTSITIPSSIISIGSQAFSNCSGLTSIIVLAETPPSFGMYAFNYVDSTIPVTVPCGCASDYEASDWHNYFTTIEEDCGPHDITIDENSMNGGNVSTSVTSTELGEEVQLTITPDDGMILASLIVSNANDPSQTVPVYSIGKSSLIYGFLMPPFDVIITATFSPATAIGENNEVLALVYPNPTNGLVKIEAEGLKQITISNTLGQTIYKGKTSGNEFVYDFGQHGEGVYLIRIGTACGVTTKRVVVTR